MIVSLPARQERPRVCAPSHVSSQTSFSPLPPTFRPSSDDVRPRRSFDRSIVGPTWSRTNARPYVRNGRPMPCPNHHLSARRPWRARALPRNTQSAPRLHTNRTPESEISDFERRSPVVYHTIHSVFPSASSSLNTHGRGCREMRRWYGSCTTCYLRALRRTQRKNSGRQVVHAHHAPTPRPG
ncbi:hypothetical protein BD413DRAFT_10729 [Trametes elegans]|nr:hypothetical protein BD413DRAFT_10729 [Trametes elegans]